MGKASQCFRGILAGMKKQDSCSPPPKPPKEKRRWSFVKSHREKDDQRQYQITTKQHSYETTATARRNSCGLVPVHQEFGAVDPSKHAMAVAAATAAVAEAAQAAAQAAAAVVRLTSSGRCASNISAYGGGSQLIGARKEQWAAVKIQAAFRGCLARRALRALKGLVKLQALVRGHLDRKRTSELLQIRMQALLRAQARMRAGRAGQISESLHLSSKSSHLQYHINGPATPEKTEHVIRRKSSTKYDQPPTLKRNGSKSNSRLIGDQDKALLGRNRSDSRSSDEPSCDRRSCSMRTGTMDDEKTDKILLIDMGKSHFTTKQKSLFHSPHNVMASDQHSHSFTISKDSTAHQAVSSPSCFEVQSSSPLKFSLQETEDNSNFYTANNSPQVTSASSRGYGSTRSPFTHTKRTDVSRSCLSGLSGYLDHPNYMAYTESSRGKTRSLSAPKQRPQFERSSSTKRHYVHGFGESRLMNNDCTKGP